MCGDTLHTGLEGKSPKEKTAMQILRQRILIRYPHGADDMTQEMKDMQSWLIDEIDLSGIATEKKQIEDARDSGKMDGFGDASDYSSTELDGEQYYESKYGNQ